MLFQKLLLENDLIRVACVLMPIGLMFEIILVAYRSFQTINFSTLDHQVKWH